MNDNFLSSADARYVVGLYFIYKNERGGGLFITNFSLWFFGLYSPSTARFSQLLKLSSLLCKYTSRATPCRNALSVLSLQYRDCTRHLPCCKLNLNKTWFSAQGNRCESCVAGRTSSRGDTLLNIWYRIMLSRTTLSPRHVTSNKLTMGGRNKLCRLSRPVPHAPT